MSDSLEFNNYYLLLGVDWTSSIEQILVEYKVKVLQLMSGLTLIELFNCDDLRFNRPLSRSKDFCTIELNAKG